MLRGARPAAGARLDDAIQPGCNDSNGGPHEDDRATDVWQVAGIPPEIALYGDDAPRVIYKNPGAFTELPQHPLHDNYYGSPRRPLRRMRGTRCTVDGDVISLSAVWIRTDGGERNVIIDARTRINGFDGAQMPILREGDAVRISGTCRDEVVYARRIAPTA